MNTEISKGLKHIIKKKSPREAFLSIYNHLKRHSIGRMRPKLQYWYYRRKYEDAAPVPWQTIEVRPRDIKYKLVPNFRTRMGQHIGTYIRSGEWDTQVTENDFLDRVKHPAEYNYEEAGGLVPIENHFLFESVIAHFEKGIPWEKTELFAIRKQQYNEEVAYQECNSIEDLYRSVDNRSYLPQSKLDTGFQRYPNPAYDEVRINIGREGQLILDDGRHRFAIAKLLNLESIPVRVFVRHSNWQQFRWEIGKDNGRSKQQMGHVINSHPDLKGGLE